jgi:hypothetical protein
MGSSHRCIDISFGGIIYDENAIYISKVTRDVVFG